MKFFTSACFKGEPAAVPGRKGGRFPASTQVRHTQTLLEYTWLQLVLKAALPSCAISSGTAAHIERGLWSFLGSSELPQVFHQYSTSPQYFLCRPCRKTLFHQYSIHGTQSEPRQRHTSSREGTKKLTLDFVVFNSHDLTNSIVSSA